MTVAIPSLRDWLYREPPRLEAIWLILGKGPSFSRLANLDQAGETSNMLRFGLNHVVRETRIDVFHCIDIEVVAHCGDAILANAGIAVLPWAPHVRRRLLPISGYREFLPSGLSLADYARRNPVLRSLAAQGRLYWYNLRTAPHRLRRTEAPITPAQGFSASAAVHLLGEAGVRRIRTLGIDGGAAYAGGFSDLADKTLLTADQDSFDSQFTSIAETIQQHGLDLAPLNGPTPPTVQIIAAADEQLPARVRAHAIETRASLSLRWEPIAPPDAHPHGNIRLPAHCLIREDARWLGNCTGADLDALTAAGRVWCWRPGQQAPWRSIHAQGVRAWCAELIDAVARGRLDRAEVAAAIAASHARPSLLAQIDHGIRDPLLLPRRLRGKDGEQLAPKPRDLLIARGRALAEALRWPVYRSYGRLILDKLPKVLAGIGR